MIEVQTVSSLTVDVNKHEVTIVGQGLDPAMLYQYTPPLRDGYRRVRYDVKQETFVAGPCFKVFILDRRVQVIPLPPDADEPICV